MHDAWATEKHIVILRATINHVTWQLGLILMILIRPKQKTKSWKSDHINIKCTKFSIWYFWWLCTCIIMQNARNQTRRDAFSVWLWLTYETRVLSLRLFPQINIERCITCSEKSKSSPFLNDALIVHSTLSRMPLAWVFRLNDFKFTVVFRNMLQYESTWWR